MWWLTSVIQALWRPRWADHLRSGVQDQPDQHGETPSIKNNNNNKCINVVIMEKCQIFVGFLYTSFLVYFG